MFHNIRGRTHTHRLTHTGSHTPAHTPAHSWPFDCRIAVAICLLLSIGLNHAPAAANWLYGSSDPFNPIPSPSTTRIGPQYDTTPAIGIDGSVYVFGDDHRLRAITPGTTGGTFKWISQTAYTHDSISPQNSPAVASDGTVWMAFKKNADNCVYALDHTDGSDKFSKVINSGKQVVGSPAIDVNDWAFVVYHDCVVALGAKNTGGYEEKWSYLLNDAVNWIPTMPAISTPQVISSGGSTWTNQLIYWAEVDKGPYYVFNNRIFALQQKQYTTGVTTTNQAWAWNFPGGQTEFPVGHLTVNHTNTIYVIGKNGSTHKLYSLNGNTGVQNWVMTLGFAPLNNPTIGTDGTLNVPGTDGVRAINPVTKTVTWTHSTGTSAVRNPPVVGIDGSLYFAYDSGNNGSVRRITAAGATVSTDTFTNRRFHNCPVVMDRKGWLFLPSQKTDSGVTGGEGQLVAVQGVGRPALSDWSMWGRGFSRNNRAGKTWRFMELDTLGGAYSVAEGISENGRVVGGAHSNTGVYVGAHVVPGVYWWTGLFLNIPYDTPAFAANNYGIIVGYTLQNGGPEAYYTQGGWGQTLLDFLPSGHTAAAVGINENARIVGYSHNSSGVQRGVFWSYGPTAPTDIRTLAGLNPSFSSTANAVSSSGRITGSSQNTSGNYRAFLTGEDGIIQGPGNDLGTLGGTYSAGHGINDAEAVTGTANNASGVARIFYKPFGQAMQDVGLLAGASSGTGEDINNNNLIVGYCYVGSYARASVAVGGLTGVADLNNATSGMTYQSLNVANAVNDREWIVGWGFDSSWRYRGFVLRPNE